MLVRNRQRLADPADMETSDTIFTGTLTFMPNSSAGKSSMRILCSLEQITRAGESLSSPHTSISFSLVRLDGSDVFWLAELGDLEGLKRMFVEGKASLTDCDTIGTTFLAVSPPPWGLIQSVFDSEHLTLIKYACYGSQLSVCKYLLEKGADPDCFGLGGLFICDSKLAL